MIDLCWEPNATVTCIQERSARAPPFGSGALRQLRGLMPESMGLPLPSMRKREVQVSLRVGNSTVVGFYRGKEDLPLRVGDQVYASVAAKGGRGKVTLDIGDSSVGMFLEEVNGKKFKE